MQVIDGENTAAFDVDETLFMHASLGSITIVNPYSYNEIHGCPHYDHIELLKQYRGRGLKIVIWSAAGVLWALEVVKALKLEDYVDVVMTKPTKFIDDHTPNEVFPCQVYLPYKEWSYFVPAGVTVV